MKDDLISRQAAIENSFEVYTKEYGWCEVVGVDAINSLPPAQPGWILCTPETMPKIGEYVLCSLKHSGYFGQIKVCKYRAADKYFDHPYFDWAENGFPQVVAWMPLPKPWEGEKNNG